MMYEWGNFTMLKTTDSKINHVISLHQSGLLWVEQMTSALPVFRLFVLQSFCWLDPLLQDPVLLFCHGGPCKQSFKIALGFAFLLSCNGELHIFYCLSEKPSYWLGFWEGWRNIFNLLNKCDGIFSAWWMNENDILFQKVTQAYSEKKSECSYQESNLRPSDY